MLIEKFRKKTEPTIQLAPLIDIVFVLLIFFAVSSSLISKNQGIPMDLPQASSVEKSNANLTISIKKNGAIYYDKMKITLNQISQIVTDYLEENPELQVNLGADKTIPYENVIQVLDQIRLAGCSNIALQTEKIIYK
jgi:biopolymer transport protein ExbD